ncbi:hypothetical protein ACFSVJ_29595 [Prauserella oleivorans]
MEHRGLRPDGTIAREGSPARVPAVFTPVVDAARSLITATFGATRLHSAYLYGSVPRGTAVAGVSDLDMLLALRRLPTDADRADAQTVEAELDRAFPQIDGAAIGLACATDLLSERERYDGGFFVACLCTPLTGPDLAEHLPGTGRRPCSRGRPTAISRRCFRRGDCVRRERPPSTTAGRSVAASAGAWSGPGSPW